MGKNYRSLEWKTSVCLVFSVLLHAGLIYYVAITQFGGGSSGVNSAGEISAVEFQTADVAPAPTPVPVSAPAVSELAEPKVEVIRPEPKPVPKVEAKKVDAFPAPKPKVAQILPKKAYIAPAPTDDSSPVVTPVASTEIAKNAEPQIEKEEMEDIKTEAIAPIEVEKEVAQETKAREELVEKVMKDEPLPEKEVVAPVQAEEAKPTTVVSTTAPAVTNEKPVAAQEAASKEVAPAVTTETTTAATNSAAPSPTPASAPATIPAGTGGTAAAAAVAAPKDGPVLPIKNDYELRAMPGNRSPEYAATDRMANRQGEVKFMAEVTPEGTLNNIRILKSSGHRTLDLAAYSAFKNYRYYPGQQSYVVKSFVFSLKGPAQVMPSRLGSRAKSTGNG